MFKGLPVVSQFSAALHHCTSPQCVRFLLIPLQTQAAWGVLLLHYITRCDGLLQGVCVFVYVWVDETRLPL